MIKFYRGLRSKYTYSEDSQFKDSLYFATDTGEVLLNGKNYGTDTQGFLDVTLNDSNVLVFTRADKTTKEVNLADKLLTAADKSALDNVKEILSSGDLNVTYNTKLDDNLATLEKLGGIAAGTKVSALKGKTITSVLDDMLFPTVNPTFVNPSASIALKSYTQVQKVGATAPTQADNFTINFSRGQIKIGNTVQDNYVGAETSRSMSCSINGTLQQGALPTKVAEGNTMYLVTINYAAGPQPKDSKGNNYGSPHAAGSVSATGAVVYGVFPFYGGIAKSVNELPLTNATSFVAKLSAESATNGKHTFKLPKKYTITKIECLNTLSGKYETYGKENFTQTDEKIAVNGTDYDYTVYTRNDAGLNGEVTYQITYTK